MITSSLFSRLGEESPSEIERFNSKSRPIRDWRDRSYGGSTRLLQCWQNRRKRDRIDSPVFRGVLVEDGPVRKSMRQISRGARSIPHPRWTDDTGPRQASPEGRPCPVDCSSQRHWVSLVLLVVGVRASGGEWSASARIAGARNAAVGRYVHPCNFYYLHTWRGTVRLMRAERAQGKHAGRVWNEWTVTRPDTISPQSDMRVQLSAIRQSVKLALKLIAQTVRWLTM